jgi:glutamate racemase
VLQALVRQFPHERFIYLGDTARVPYGSKSARTVERYTIQVANALLQRDVKLLVVACNTASALGLSALHRHSTIPAFGVIEPGCRMALSITRNRCIGVIATRSTIASHAYLDTLMQLDATADVHSLACPMFVPLAEEGWRNHPATTLIVAESLAPLAATPVDTLILGCTHYPLLREAIQTYMGDGVRIVDSASAVACTLDTQPVTVWRRAPADAAPEVSFLVTDVADRFQEVAERFLDGCIAVPRVEVIDLSP